MHVIYLDVLFFINCFMDFMIFWTTTLVLNKQLCIIRHVKAAIIGGGIYCLLVVVPFLKKMPYGLYGLWTPIVPVLYLYTPRNFKEFMRYLLLCTGIAAVYGGVIFNVWFMLVKADGQLHSISWWMLVVLAGGIAIVFNLIFYWGRRCFVFNHFTYELQLSRAGHKLKLMALMDTGNLLYTPVTHRPVMVAAYKAVKTLLTEKEQSSMEKFFKCHHEEAVRYLFLSENGPSYLIPFNSVGCQSGYLWGIQLDSVKISSKIGEKVVRNCIVGIAQQNLHSDQQYSVLLHPEYIIKGETAI